MCSNDYHHAAKYALIENINNVLNFKIALKVIVCTLLGKCQLVGFVIYIFFHVFYVTKSIFRAYGKVKYST